MPPLITFTQHSFGSPSPSNQRRKRNKGNPKCKGRSKTVTADDLIPYTKILKSPLENYYSSLINLIKLHDIKSTDKNLLHYYTLIVS